MGSSVSFLEAEKRTWADHTLLYDGPVREENLKSLADKFSDGEDIYLTSTDSSYLGINFKHWFVTNKNVHLEFGGPSLSIYDARVTINTSPRFQFPISKSTDRATMSEEMRSRMRDVLGMCNYSLCLRNCEHVANYVFHGHWFCGQMAGGGLLMKIFQSKIVGNDARKINAFPASIRPHTNMGPQEKIYNFAKTTFKLSRLDYYLDYEEDTYNILIVGTTGSGKSRLINVLFNSTVCESATSHASVTKDIFFVRGTGSIYSEARQCFEHQKVIIADTVGLCDTEWDENKIIEFVKGRVSTSFTNIDAVYVVLKADRIMPNYVSNIQKILSWLRYTESSNYKRFCFIFTHAANVTGDKENEMRSQAMQQLNLRQGTSIIYTDFPPQDDLTERAKGRVEMSIEKLAQLQLGYGNRLKAKTSTCVIL